MLFRSLEAQFRKLRGHLRLPMIPGDSAALRKLRTEIAEYLEGKRTEFTLPLAYRGSEFEETVWNQLLQIPAGETRSYQDIARALGNPKGSRAVGRANGMNRIAILIPAAFSGSRYLSSPMEGTVPAYLALVSIVNGALHGKFLWRPMSHAVFLMLMSSLVFAVVGLLPINRATITGVVFLLLCPVAGGALLHGLGWYLPFGQLAMVTTLLLLLRGAHHSLITHLERASLQNSLALGSAVQKLLLPSQRSGRCGSWEYAIGFHPYEIGRAHV